MCSRMHLLGGEYSIQNMKFHILLKLDILILYYMENNVLQNYLRLWKERTEPIPGIFFSSKTAENLRLFCFLNVKWKFNPGVNFYP